jgi:hypothetical protein
MANRAAHLDEVLSEFPLTVATSICLLEFKATLIQECITIHDNVRLRKRFTLVRDSLLEKKHRQVSLRAHIFNNLLDGYPVSSFNVTLEEDERLARKARLKLEADIPALYDWFVQESVDAVLSDGIACTRATERPDKKGRVSFRPNLRQCVRGENKTCSVEAFIRNHAERIIPALREHQARLGEDAAGQLARALELFESVVHNPDSELSHGDCRRAGDCLIALEAKGHATHALSTNAREWEPLSRVCGFEFVGVEYPDEKTR